MVSFVVEETELARVETALTEALEPMFTIEEVFPDLGPDSALRGARGLREMTQAQLAAAIGVHKSHISEMERGKRPIGKEMAKRLGQALNMNWRIFL
jgi:DNA-binding XRE family transcriptional regulator